MPDDDTAEIKIEQAGLRAEVRSIKDVVDRAAAQQERQWAITTEAVERWGKKFTSLAADYASDKKGRKTLTVIGGIVIGALLGSIAATATWAIDRIDAGDAKNSADIAKVEGETDKLTTSVETTAVSIDGLRRDVDKNEKKIDDLRKLHRLPDESDGLRPGKEN